MSDGERHDRYKTGKLSPKTIRNHVAFVSGIFEHAIKMQVVSVNPCRAVTLPRDNPQEKEIYSVEEAQKILQLLFKEESKNLHFILYFALAVYTGFRRGELLGLEYKDFNLERQTVSTNRASAYNSERGIYTDSLKTRNSYRTLKMPAEVMNLLARYQQQQAEYAKSIGNHWVTQISGLHDKMVDNDRLFTQWHGLPMHPNAPALFFERFCKRHKIRYINCHGLRHFNISTQIFAGIDVRTVSMNAGHCNPNVTLGIYSHAFAAANAFSMERLIEVIGIPDMPEESSEDSAGMFTGKSAPKNTEKIKSAPTLHQDGEIA
jgi:integrase